jgi:enoyl-[acyl-carrier protein] reductase III
MSRGVDLSGQRALVTGGSRGVGAAIARALATAGADVVVGFRSGAAEASALCEEIAAAGGRCRAAGGNLAKTEGVRELFAQVGAEPLDVVVHAAALGAFKPTLAVRPNQWDLTMSVGARAFLQCVQQAAPSMREGGRILAVSSPGSQRVVPSYGLIGVSKAAMEAVVRYAAVELAPRGIRVNAVSAGFIEGTSVRNHPGYEELRRQAVARTPAGRLATMDDVAGTVLLFCSPLASWITGQTIMADGGATLLL